MTLSRIIGRFPNGTVVSGHIDYDTNHFHLYRSQGNTDVYETDEVSISHVLIGKYIRTDYRS